MRFVGEKSLYGDVDEIKEYTIGVEAFGRGNDFNPSIDPIVRVQAARLRQKLEEYYRSEGTDDPVLINLQKGAYIPAFARRSGTPVPEVIEAQTNGRLWNRFSPRARALAVAVAALLIASVLLSTRFFTVSSGDADQRASEVPKSALETIFGGFFNGKKSTVLYFHVPVVTTYEEPQGLQERRKSFTGVGELNGSLLLSQVFTQHGKRLDVQPSTALDWDDFGQANVILLGGPRQNTLFRQLQSNLNFIYPFGKPGEVRNLKPLPGEQSKYETTLDAQGNGVDYGVVSSMVHPISGNRILLFGGNTGISVEAGARYMADPANASFLVKKLTSRSGRFPAKYQVLLKVTSKDAIPYSTEYVASRSLLD